MFQFHNGTINTLRHKYSTVFSLCFNSTTVQLIQTRHYCTDKEVEGFNSTTVQLIPNYLHRKKRRSATFQFHNGTINTTQKERKHLSIAGFNSTTVQLILCRDRWRIPQPMFQFHNGTINTSSVIVSVTNNALFQFHNGTINTSNKHKKTVSVFSFNSTTVQLIPCCFKVFHLIFIVFQFHNGTINTTSRGEPTAYAALFQFHNGTINTYNRSTHNLSYVVSIPQRYN